MTESESIKRTLPLRIAAAAPATARAERTVKKIETIIKPFKLDDVKDALEEAIRIRTGERGDNAV